MTFTDVVGVATRIVSADLKFVTSRVSRQPELANLRKLLTTG